ncbi:RHS repeat protein [Lysobacter sp. A6]|uniref:RHS repeat protein n=1 Tax=Noviluteimonas lactosilytica TaxID=2888523 RepID=A0ABS8JDY0_9GAMM|nr:RHS repeat-associated core domain-containing protein [Lysobacter lactosilyticus]MCC8361806.1 RHS repeat protein [Lysobacter lactosilyticus]
MKRIATTVLAASLAASVLPAAAQTYTRTDTQTYEDNLASWVLGQPKKSTNDNTGLAESETIYDAATALPLRTYKFGKLQQTLTYNGDGTLATASNGNDSPTFNTTVTFSSWKRGLPQRIDFPTSEYKTLSIDDYGLIRHVIDENGFKTCYAFDAMGRLSGITYPSKTTAGACDASWNKLVRTFQSTTDVEYGLSAGHWREFVQTGQGIKAVYYDAMWRPVLTRTYDKDDINNTLSQTVTQYDHDGKPVLQSYPTRDVISNFASPLPGTRTTYDGLGRPTRVAQDTDGGEIVSTTQYLANFVTRTTNPRDKSTDTTYLTYDQPNTDWPLEIAHPDSVYTDIARDTFGKPTVLARSGPGVMAIRSYAYNAAQELCRMVEPETAATLYGYDAAGNLAWSAAGLADNTACDFEGDTAAILARKVVREYDQRNRIKQLAFADGRGDTTYTYTPDSLHNVLTVDNGDTNVVKTTYAYDQRRQLTLEKMDWNSLSWRVGHGYDANGFRASQSFQGTDVVTFAPNALGQPTKAGTYATGVTYYPNGAMAGFTYGNGIVHSLTQNARQLPLKSRDAYGTSAVPLDHTYSYDENGNVTSILDGTDATRNRAMVYDNLDRLTQMTSLGMLGGTGKIFYTYDGLDNITAVSSPNRSQRYCYDANNRLEFLRAGATVVCPNGAATVAFGYDVQGNLAYKNNVNFVFDLGNRLRATNGGVSSGYVYDALGRRARDYVTSSKYSLYTQAGQLAHTSDANGSAEYIYLNGSLVAIARTPSGGSVPTVEYQHTDALGTPVATSTASRQITKSDYEPYGRVLNRAVKDGPGFTGHVEDAATGLVQMQQRYYDSLVGRFLSVDPVTARPIGDNFNRYWYANNNPYRFTDPDGRETGMFQRPEFRMAQPDAATTASAVGLIADFTPVVGDAKGVYEAMQQPTWTNISAAGVGFVPLVGDMASKAIKNADTIADVGKAVADANRADNLAKGIPASQLGPSGKPKIHTVEHGGKRGEAKEAARRENGKGGTTANHTTPAVGKDHYHGVSKSGEKSRIHHEYE